MLKPAFGVGLVLAASGLFACGADATGDSSSAGQGGASGGSGGSSGGSGGSGGSGASVTGGGGSGGSATGGAAGTGASGGAAGSGASAGAAGAGGTGGTLPACDDPGPEPNETVLFAISACGVPACDVTDCDSDGSVGYGGKKAPIQGVVGPGDVDNFRYDGKDTTGLCWVDAAAKTKDYGFRLCLFATCAKGATQVSACPGGLAFDTEGAPGCCVTAPGEVKITYDCVGSINDDDSARMVVRTDEASVCTSYTLDYHF